MNPFVFKHSAGACTVLFFAFFITVIQVSGRTFIIDQSAPLNIQLSYFSPSPVGGDTISISTARTTSLKFNNLTGNPGQPIVVINSGGQVNIYDHSNWGALSFINCRYLKVTGTGSPKHHFGFRLSGEICGLAFTEYSSDCEAEYLEIHSTLFFGIYAKKDFGGDPPTPYPVFSNLVIHDNYIHHVEEGMYIGETKSPGMEFRHLRIYNNVVTHCIREAIQLANCVEDIEVYNNFCAYNGLGNLYAQSNNFQIGGNTIGRYYNNILIHAPENGIICLGSGDIEVTGNYLSDNHGVYIDNRKFLLPYSGISFDGNYIRNTEGTEVITNANEKNELHIRNNLYNTPVTFSKAGKPAPAVWDTAGNLLQELDSLRYSIVNGLYVADTGNPGIYSSLGPVTGLGYVMNATPVLDSIGPIILSYGDTLVKTITATTADNDFLSFFFRELPGFVQFQVTGNGTALLSMISSAANKGVYYPTLLVRDSSHRQYDRETFKIAIRDTSNRDPLLQVAEAISIEALTKLNLNITALDPDPDPITYTFLQLPSFVSFSSTTDSAWIDIKPLLPDPGTYHFSIIADDGYGVPDTAAIVLTVTEPGLIPGRVLYRVNCAGPELEDQPINWQMDIGTDPVYGSNTSYGTGSHSWSGINTTGAPNNLFGPFRHNGPAPRTMGWSFPVPTNGLYRAKLFFAERPTEVNNNTTGTFHISLEDSLVMSNFNIYNQVGYAACRLDFDAEVSDGALDILFTPVLNDAKVNGFEICLIEKQNNPPEIALPAEFEMQEGDTTSWHPQIQDDGFPGCDSLRYALVNAPSFFSMAFESGNPVVFFHPGYSDAGTYQDIQFIVSDGCLSDTARLLCLVNNVFINTPPQFIPLADVSMDEGGTASIPVSASDPDNQTLTLSMTGIPSFSQFQQTGNGTGNLLISPGYNDAGTYTLQFMVEDGAGGSDTVSFVLTVINVPQIVRIPLNASMIHDLVRPPYGSYVSANYLVDEQTLNPTLNQHALSSSWKPYFNLSFAPYHIYFDLGDDYVLRKLYLHDMHNVANLEVSYGSPGLWTNLLTEPCNAFNTWKLHEINISTRYLRLSMTNTVNAAVNEIALYGYVDESKSSPFQEITEVSGGFGVHPNPFSFKITVSGVQDSDILQLYSIHGKLLAESGSGHLDTAPIPAGTYILLVRDQAGQLLHSEKLIKSAGIE